MVLAADSSGNNPNRGRRRDNHLSYEYCLVHCTSTHSILPPAYYVRRMNERTASGRKRRQTTFSIGWMKVRRGRGRPRRPSLFASSPACWCSSGTRPVAPSTSPSPRSQAAATKRDRPQSLEDGAGLEDAAEAAPSRKRRRRPTLHQVATAAASLFPSVTPVSAAGESSSPSPPTLYPPPCTRTRTTRRKRRQNKCLECTHNSTTYIFREGKEDESAGASDDSIAQEEEARPRDGGGGCG